MLDLTLSLGGRGASLCKPAEKSLASQVSWPSSRQLTHLAGPSDGPGLLHLPASIPVPQFFCIPCTAYIELCAERSSSLQAVAKGGVCVCILVADALCESGQGPGGCAAATTCRMNFTSWTMLPETCTSVTCSPSCFLFNHYSQLWMIHTYQNARREKGGVGDR